MKGVLMDTYFERLEQIIERHEKEIDHLNSERVALRNEENNMSFNQFSREYQNIIDHLENETRSLRQAQNTLDSYRSNYSKALVLVDDLKSLRDELNAASNGLEEDNLNADIRRKETELESILNLLPLELADSLRSTLVENETVKEEEVQQQEVNEQAVQEVGESKDATLDDEFSFSDALDDYDKVSSDIENLNRAIADNERALQESIARMNEIFQEERQRFENEGPFDNEKLNSLQEYYMGLKIAENEVFIEAKRNQTRLARKLKSLNKKQEEIRQMDKMASAFEVSYAEFKELSSTLKNRKIITHILEQRGLENIIHKKSRTKEEKAILNEALNQIRKEIITYRKENENVSIKEAINVLYGMDNKVVKKAQSKSMKMPEKNYLALIDNTKQLPAVIRNDSPIQQTKEVLSGPKEFNNLLDDKRVAFPLLPDLQAAAVDTNKTTGPKPLEGVGNDKEEGNLENDDNEIVLPQVKVNSNEGVKKVTDENVKDNGSNNNNSNNNVNVNPSVNATGSKAPIGNEATVSTKEQQPVLKKGLREIFGDLRRGLEIGKKDGKRYQYSNLKVSQNFKNELQSGNVLYNIVHVVPAVVKATTQLLSKISGKILLGSDARKMIETLEDRVDNLSVDDLETIFKEYRGNRINQERYPLAFNMVIERKMSEYILGKVSKINQEIENSYKDVFHANNLLKATDENLRKGKISSEEKLQRLDQRRRILKVAADNIKYIRDAKVEADNLLSGGLHGLSEDMKAAASKLNCVGMRFAKNHDMDQELEDALMECEKRENKAIYENNDEDLLKAFLDSEVLLSENTEITTGLTGKKSTGKKYYSPLATQLDYRNDPFVRDLFTTIAVSMAAVNASNVIKNQEIQGEKYFNNQEALINKVHEAGEYITSRKGAMYKGMRAQANQDVLSSAGSIERSVLDKTNWGLGTDVYHTADSAGHEFYNAMYNNLQERFANVTNAYSSGAINQTDVLEQLASISNDTHNTLVNVADECLKILKPYAESNTRFDLAGFQDTMQFLVDHPNAIANMNQAMVDVQNLGDELVSLSTDQLEMINNLPGDLGPTLLSAASTCALAQRVASSMAKTQNKRYGNEVTEMVSDYAYANRQDEEEKKIR